MIGQTISHYRIVEKLGRARGDLIRLLSSAGVNSNKDPTWLSLVSQAPQTTQVPAWRSPGTRKP